MTDDGDGGSAHPGSPRQQPRGGGGATIGKSESVHPNPTPPPPQKNGSIGSPPSEVRSSSAGPGGTLRFKKTHQRTESVLSKISRLSVKSLGKGADGLGGDGYGDDGEDEDEMDAAGRSHAGSKCLLLQTRPALMVKFYDKFQTFPCLHCRFRTLPKWKFNSKFEWRTSSTKFERRLVSVGNILSAEELFTACSASSESMQQYQTVFRGGKNSRENHVKTSKYHWYSFVPVNIFEQFRRLVNLYFLVVVILLYATPKNVRPVDPSSWCLSLAFIVVVTMGKQAYEDYLRHKVDRKNNQRKVNVLRNGSLTKIPCEEVRVGEIIHLLENDFVPADAVVLSTSNAAGVCYIMTANLDGETSLKTKHSAKATSGFQENFQTPPDSDPSYEQHLQNSKQPLSTLMAAIECENPNPKLDNFLGRLFVLKSEDGSQATDGKTSRNFEPCSLTADNLILSGTQVKNTKDLFCVCVYAGQETKMSLNSQISKNKFSTIEKTYNNYIMFFLIILLIELVVFTILSMSWSVYWKHDDLDGKFARTLSFLPPSAVPEPNPTHSEHHWYLYGKQKSAYWLDWLIQFFAWLALLQIIPISLYVTLEVQKVILSMQFGWDSLLYDKERDQPAICRTSDISEELGLVSHLFADKTGTLTQNIMVLKKLYHAMPVTSVPPQSYMQQESIDTLLDASEALQRHEYDQMVMAMLLCHSVEVADDGHFVASSPDEKAILELLSTTGFHFLGMDKKTKTISVRVRAGRGGQDKVHKYKRMAELPFDSDRKCMSIIVREESVIQEDTEPRLHVFVKGADSAVLPACSGGLGATASTERRVNEMSAHGLRTLVYGHKEIDQDRFVKFVNDLDIARSSIVNRVSFMRDVYCSLEQDLSLLGAIGIEDRLQEGVVETIHKLNMAGITTWMLTGDKKETAMNLASASGLLRSRHSIVDLCEVKDWKSLYALLRELYSEFSDNVMGSGSIGAGTYFYYQQPKSLIIDGKAVAAVMTRENMKRRLAFVSSCCQTVIACRLSPVQKSQLVRLMKNWGAQTAAIGDGGNDISMIQEAHVGFGIIGQEGVAASEAADFAFTKFKYLQRVLLVHGHWYVSRLANMVQFSFYKSLLFTCQLLFAFYSNFSSQSLFDAFFIIFYSTFYTSLPAFLHGILEKRFPAVTLMREPKLYKINRNGTRVSVLFRWCAFSLWHTLVIFYGWKLFIQESTASKCNSGMAINSLGSQIGGSCVTVANLKILLESRDWNIPFCLSVLASIAFYVAFTFLLQLIYIPGTGSIFTGNVDEFRTYWNSMSGDCALPTIFINVLIVVAALTPDLVWVTYRCMTLDGTHPLSLLGRGRRVKPERYSNATSYAVNTNSVDTARSHGDFLAFRQYNNSDNDVELKHVRPRSS